MALLFKLASGIAFAVQMLGLLILGVIFIIAPELAMSLGLGVFKFKTALTG